MKLFITIIFTSFIFFSSLSQVKYGKPTIEDVPKKLKKLNRKIIVQNFPKIINPIKIKNKFYWKHNTVIFSKENEIKITEFGAYIYYNDKWNLRKIYALKYLDKNFGTRKQVLQKAQPYTWNDNWRTDTRLFGGWALWYFIGITEKGETVCGYEIINTTNNLIN